MNINHLAAFHAVACEGSVSRGAERLCVSQPAVSKQIRELERSLGVALFHRLSSGVALTDAGELLATYARQIFSLEAEAGAALRELKGLERGRLRVGASSTIGVYLLPPVCAAFQRLYPGLEMMLEVGNTSQIQQRLRDHELDLALSEGLVTSTDLQTEEFGHDHIVVIGPPHAAPARSPMTAEQLSRQPLILREAGSGTGEVVLRAFGARGLTPRPVLTLGSTEAIKRAVASGDGLALVSDLAVEHDVAAGRLALIPMLDLCIRRPFHRLRVRGKYEGRAVREFLRLLRQGTSAGLNPWQD